MSKTNIDATEFSGCTYRQLVEQLPDGGLADQLVQLERQLPVEPLPHPVRVPQLRVQKLQNQIDGHDGGFTLRVRCLDAGQQGLKQERGTKHPLTL